MLDTKRIRGEHLLPYLRNVDVQWDRINTSDLPLMDITPAEYDRYTLKSGDLLVCEGGEVGRCATWRGDLAICGFQKALHRLRPISGEDVPRFLHYVLMVASQSGGFADGHESTIAHLTGDKLRAHRFSFPPLIEQSAVVRFLDHADRRIRRYIRAKRRLMALLNEQRQAIIHRAVTRGLDADVGLRHSGVEWLGDLPVHWEVRRAKQLFREVDSRSTTGTETLLSLRMFRGLVPHSEVSQIPITSKALVGFKRVAPGQIVMNRMRAAIGLFGVVRQSGLVSPDYAVFEPSEVADCDYFLHLFTTRAAGAVFRLESKGLGTGSAGFMRLYTDRFGIIKLPLPPPDEQRAIVQEIAVGTVEIDQTMDRINREVNLLREYRSRLVTDVVTGKVDVREAAAGLPDESEESLCDANALTEGDMETEDISLDAATEEAEA